MEPVFRQRCLSLLFKCRSDFLLCRQVESTCHSLSSSEEEYISRIRRSAYNLHMNKDLREEVAYGSEAVLTKGTLFERVIREEEMRKKRFEDMLKEKYDALDDGSCGTVVKCRRCGGDDVLWEEKQTRSADEAATVYCLCNTCKNRWVLR